MDDTEDFNIERMDSINRFSRDRNIQNISRAWTMETMRARYVYNFDWLGRPIIQYPQDVVAIQELIWRVKPDLIVETGVARGGSLVFSASMLALLDLFDATERRELVDPRRPQRKVVGIDIDIRPHNRSLIEAHPLGGRISLIQGSSIEKKVIDEVRSHIEVGKRTMVFLDSMHTHEHVLMELEAYADLVSPDSYCVVFDTFIEDLPAGFFADRPWDVGNNPKTAVFQFLKTHSEFEIDKSIEEKLGISVCPSGFLKRKS